MAALTVNSMVLNTTGTDITPAGTLWESAASAGDYFASPTNGQTFLLVDTSATTCTVTVASQATCDHGSTHNIALSMAANEIRTIGPFAPSRFDDTDGRVQLTYSTITDLRVCVIKL